MSPGWHPSAAQIASSVEKRIALALPVLSIERFAWLSPINAASSPDGILRLAIITSRLTTIGIWTAS